MALDFDGTLSPIVPHPEDARLDPALEAVLGRLGTATGWVVVISGRDRQFLQERVPGVIAIGSYGLELPEAISSAGLLEGFPAAHARRRLDLARAELQSALVPGSRLEVKPWGLALHYRGAGSRFDEPAAQRLVAEVAERHDLAVQQGRLVLEVKPRGAVDKGSALGFVVARLQPSAVVFVGDDLGDLPAWEATRGLGPRIPTLAVAIASAELPAEALAACDLVLSDRAVLRAFLENLAALAEAGGRGPG